MPEPSERSSGIEAPPADSSGNDPPRRRLLQVFRYLEALNQLRNPVVRQIDDQPWILRLRSLPAHSTVQRGLPGTEADEGDDFLLKVRRTTVPDAPALPEALAAKVSIASSPLQSPTIRDSLDDGEQTLYDSWASSRARWTAAHGEAYRARQLFEELYGLHTRFEQEGERIELVLGDGVLNWRRPEGGIHHPVLLVRLLLEFDAGKVEFTLREAGRGPELYSALFRGIGGVDGKRLAEVREHLEAEGYHPMDPEPRVAEFYRRLAIALSPSGEYEGDGPPAEEREYPRIGREPFVFLRNRTLGFATALEAILDDIPTREDLPGPLLSIVDAAQVGGTQGSGSSGLSGSGNEEEAILFTKPANPEQLAIVRRLERNSGVVVQGPPGTGKTHTIANLIGHFLAQGKTVLVTSHTTKALRVLRDQVAEELRPLCVSVLESDAAGQEQLKHAVEAMVQHLGTVDPQTLRVEVRRDRERRGKVLERLTANRQRLLEARQLEYTPVVHGALSFMPSDAARRVAAARGRADWVPGRVEPGRTLPLTTVEFRQLYRTNHTLTQQEEGSLGGALPDPGRLPAPASFKDTVERMRALEATDKAFGTGWWLPGQRTAESLDELLREAQRSIEPLRSDGWQLTCIDAGRRGAPFNESWLSLRDLVQRVCRLSSQHERKLLDFGPQLPPGEPSHHLETLASMLAHTRAGKPLSGLALWTHPRWKQFIKEARVRRRPPRSVEELEALQALAVLQLERRALVDRWNAQMVPLGAQPLGDADRAVEWVAEPVIAQIETALAWTEQAWAPILAAMGAAGVPWERALGEVGRPEGRTGDLLQTREAVVEFLPRLLAAEAGRLSLTALEAEVGRLQDGLAALARKSPEASQLFDTVVQRDPSAYETAHGRLTLLLAKHADFELRRGLLRRLAQVAPDWADAIQARRGVHGQSELPGDPEEAWLVRQLAQELEQRDALSVEELQAAIARDEVERDRITASLAERQAWTEVVERTDQSHRRALLGWKQTISRIGRGTGKRVPRLLAEARKLMAECSDAVPVWIMPIQRAVEAFDPRTSRFDVVIVDEASQSDVLALTALYLGRQVLIVGDHEQVTPDAVGQDVMNVDRLISEHLRGIKNSHLYDLKFSIYELAQQSFGGTLSLLEHFRCVPDIIEFSNHLCYDGKIRPLRDDSSEALKPATVTVRVDGQAEQKRNKEEAWTIASLIAAVMERREYDNKTIGVISMVGEHQARDIQQLLHQFLPPLALEQRKILCGTAAQFQGDERNVVFISMVDSPKSIAKESPGPLPKREQDLFRKRFNVAASRPKDQLWVVHSLDARRDLKEGDLRRRLIEHAENPQALRQRKARAAAKAESDFEREVIHRLVAQGYDVRPQWWAGAYRIDIVVVGADGSRLAVECDGDKYHPLEKLPEDLVRQAILERAGWRFVRIRGSDFYREPDEAMRPVFRRLEQLGIKPKATHEGQPASRLREDLVARAAEIRREWEERVQSPPVPAGLAEADTNVRTGHGRSTGPRSPMPEAVPSQGDPSLPMPSPLAGLQASEPSAEPPSKDEHPLVLALVEKSPTAALTCHCGGTRRMWVGRLGPFWKCTDASCASTEGVPVPLVQEAVREMALPCPACEKKLHVLGGRYGAFVRCSSYPQCSTQVPWKALRKLLE